MRSLYVQVLVAIAIGVALGVLAPGTATMMKPLGDGFIKLIRMMIAPVIFVTVVLGIAGTSDLKKVGTTGGLALIYFEIVSTVALIIGLVVVNVIKPGAGMNVDVKTLNTGMVSAYAGPASWSRYRTSSCTSSRPPLLTRSLRERSCRFFCSRCFSALRCNASAVIGLSSCCDSSKPSTMSCSG